MKKLLSLSLALLAAAAMTVPTLAASHTVQRGDTMWKLAVQYQVGMQNAKCIVSINHNAASPIFDISLYGAVADFKAVLPAVIAEIKNRRA